MAAFEVRAVRMVVAPNGTIERFEIGSDHNAALPPRQLAQLVVSTAVCFFNFEHRNTAKAFGLDPDAILDRLTMWQAAMLRFVERLEQNAPSSAARLVGAAIKASFAAATAGTSGS